MCIAAGETQWPHGNILLREAQRSRAQILEYFWIKPKRIRRSTCAPTPPAITRGICSADRIGVQQMGLWQLIGFVRRRVAV